MKNIFIALFLLIVIASVLYKNLTWTVADREFDYLAVHYPSKKSCKSCKTFKHRIFKVSWLYNRHITFATYRPNIDNTSRKILKKNKFLNVCRKEKRKNVLIVYEIKSKKIQSVFRVKNDFKAITKKIDLILRNN